MLIQLMELVIHVLLVVLNVILIILQYVLNVQLPTKNQTQWVFVKYVPFPDVLLVVLATFVFNALLECNQI